MAHPAERVFNTFHYFAFGLSQSLAEEYVDLPQAVAPALAALMRSKVWERPEQKLRCRKAIRRIGLPLAEAFVLDRIIDTQLQLNPAQEKRYRELERLEGKEVQEMVITWEDALAERYAEGEARNPFWILASGRPRDRPDSALPGCHDLELAASRDAITCEKPLPVLDAARSPKKVVPGGGLPPGPGHGTCPP